MRRAVVIAAALSIATFVMTPSWALTPMPTPGTAAQDKTLVAGSTSIAALPSNLIPTLSAAPNDDADAYYPSSDINHKGCSTVTACVYGDTSSSTTLVLYGDSHAQMWLPALAPDAAKLHLRLVLIWHPGCQVEDFPMANVTCDSYRTYDIGIIKALKPAMVILSQKVTEITGPNGKVYTNAQWTADLEVTIRALQSSNTKVLVSGDTNQFSTAVPVCLSKYPAAVQKCAIYNPNPKYTQHFAAEKNAAVASGADYVNPIPWMCTTSKCSPIVGTMVVESDMAHITATFSEYLSGLWLTQLTKFGL